MRNKELPMSKMSFLGTLNNREDNLKKLAKHNSARLNILFEQRENGDKKRVLSSAANTGYTSSNASKRNVLVKKPYVPQVPGKSLSNSSHHNITNNLGGKVNTGLSKPKDFVIKQKVKREYTNENSEQV